MAGKPSVGAAPPPGASPSAGAGAAATQEDGEPTFYEVLEVNRLSSDAEVRKSYRKLVLQWHPDKHPSNRDEAEDKIRLINRAYEVLGNPVKRSGYDQQHDALERKRRGVRLETSSIKPRMSIPKEFMLCPLGHPEKFVRAVGCGLKVQGREDVPGCDHKQFFAAARFSLWWLPEVNNMCRLRILESAGAGVDGGLNLNFMMPSAQAGVLDADVSLSPNADPRYANIMAVASPYAKGAFRLEGAFYPGHYLSFRPPSTVRMASLVDEAQDVVDFILEDHSTMFKFLTVQEVLAPAIEAQGHGDYVKLSDLRADMTVRIYFQNTLGCQVWNNSDFGVYFEGHDDTFDFDAKRARVRIRPLQQQLAKRLQSASRTGLAQAVAGAGPEIEELPLQAATPAIRGLSEAPASNACGRALLEEAQLRLLTAVPAMPADSVPLGMLVFIVKMLAKIGAEGADPRLAEARPPAMAALTQHIINRISEVTFEMLTELLELPLQWAKAARPLGQAIAPLLAVERPLGALVNTLRAAIRAGPEAKVIAEALGQRELAALRGAADSGAVPEVFEVLAEESYLLQPAVAELRPPVLDHVPVHILTTIVGAVAEGGHDVEALTPSLGAIAAAPTEKLARATPAALLRFAVAATKSTTIAECGLSAVAAAAAASLPAWTTDDAATLLLAVAKAKGAAGSPGGQELFSRSSEVLSPKVREFTTAQVIKISLAISSVDQCTELLARVAHEAQSRLSDMKPSQLLLLTRGLLPLGIKNRDVAQIIDFWAARINEEGNGGDSRDGQVSVRRRDLEARAALSADQLVQLLQMLVPIVEGEHLVVEAIGKRVLQKASELTQAGKTGIASIIGGEHGPAVVKLVPLLRDFEKADRSSPSPSRRRRATSPLAARSEGNKKVKRSRTPTASRKRRSDRSDSSSPRRARHKKRTNS